MNPEEAEAAMMAAIGVHSRGSGVGCPIKRAHTVFTCPAVRAAVRQGVIVELEDFHQISLFSRADGATTEYHNPGCKACARIAELRRAP